MSRRAGSPGRSIWLPFGLAVLIAVGVGSSITKRAGRCAPETHASSSSPDSSARSEPAEGGSVRSNGRNEQAARPGNDALPGNIHEAMPALADKQSDYSPLSPTNLDVWDGLNELSWDKQAELARAYAGDEEPTALTATADGTLVTHPVPRDGEEVYWISPIHGVICEGSSCSVDDSNAGPVRVFFVSRTQDAAEVRVSGILDTNTATAAGE